METLIRDSAGAAETRRVPAAPAPAPRAVAAVLDRGTLWGKVARCLSVSALTTALSLTVLLVATDGLGIAAWLANVVAVSVATVPSYLLNRRWTWRKEGAHDVWREVVPFWAMAFAGLALSTVCVALTDGWLPDMRIGSELVGNLALVAAHLSGFGLLWIVEFVVLDRVLFAQR
jgi:putative flippase GtrA